MYGSLQAVHTNFHAKSGVCSSKNGRVMAISLIFPSLRIFFRESLKLFFCMDPCRQFIRTSMQNLESVAQKWASYCTMCERGHYIHHHISIYLQVIIQSKLCLFEVRKFGQYITFISKTVFMPKVLFLFFHISWIRLDRIAKAEVI